MTREEKKDIVASLKSKLEAHEFFYITDASTLSVEEVNDFRRECYNNDIEMTVYKNTLIKKALESFEEEKNYVPLFSTLTGPTAILFTDTANAPGKVLQKFRKDHDRPVLKGAYIETEIYLGDEQIKPLAELKSKEDLLGEIILLLQSPAKNVIGALQSGGSTIAGLVKTLQEKGTEN